MVTENLNLAKETVQELTIEELNHLSKFIEEVIIVKREDALDEALKPLQNLAQTLGVSVPDLINKKTRRKAKEESVVKYRDTDNIKNTWSGRGNRPAWIKKAIANGKKLEDFLI